MISFRPFFTARAAVSTYRGTIVYMGVSYIIDTSNGELSFTGTMRHSKSCRESIVVVNDQRVAKHLWCWQCICSAYELKDVARIESRRRITNRNLVGCCVTRDVCTERKFRCLLPEQPVVLTGDLQIMAIDYPCDLALVGFQIGVVIEC